LISKEWILKEKSEEVSPPGGNPSEDFAYLPQSPVDKSLLRKHEVQKQISSKF